MYLISDHMLQGLLPKEELNSGQNHTASYLEYTIRSVIYVFNETITFNLNIFNCFIIDIISERQTFGRSQNVADFWFNYKQCCCYCAKV